MPTLSSFVLHEIMQLLRQPLPLPHANHHERSIIRQPALAACLRVCRDWYNAAAPALYTYPITDDFPNFLSGHNGPHIPGIIPKIELLGGVTRLFIEYTFKSGTAENAISEAVDWTYNSLLELLGDNDAIEDDIEDINWNRQFGWEVKQLAEALGAVTGWPALRKPTIFGRLRTVAVGAFYGHEEAVAQVGHGGMFDWEEYDINYRALQLSFSQLIASIPTLHSYCQAPAYGPLSLGESTYFPGKSDSHPIVAIHVPGEDENFNLHTAIGVPLRRYFHRAQWNGMPKSVMEEDYVHELSNLVLNRDFLARQQRHRTAPNSNIDLTIYHDLPDWIESHLVYPYSPYVGQTWQSPPAEADKAAWRGESEDLEKAILEKMAEGKRKWQGGDSFAFRQLFDAPPCEACGWDLEGAIDWWGI